MWLLAKATKRSTFDANKLYASQLLHILLQSTESARKKLSEEKQGIDRILRVKIYGLTYLIFEKGHFEIHLKSFHHNFYVIY